jgi:ribose transport system ATP-binding protein
LLGLVLAFSVAAFIGLINGFLVRVVKLSPLITTLAMFIALQGVSLSLRSTPDGFFRREIAHTLNLRFGFLPVAFIVVVIVAIGLEIILRKTRFGMGVRAVGSNEVSAYRLGARVNRTAILAYVLCSLFAAAGGVLLAAQVGVGDRPSARITRSRAFPRWCSAARAFLAASARSLARWRPCF